MEEARREAEEVVIQLLQMVKKGPPRGGPFAFWGNDGNPARGKAGGEREYPPRGRLEIARTFPVFQGQNTPTGFTRVG